MSHIPFTVGQIVTNNEMRTAYRIGNMGGMRKSNIYKPYLQTRHIIWLSESGVDNIDNTVALSEPPSKDARRE